MTGKGRGATPSLKQRKDLTMEKISFDSSAKGNVSLSAVQETLDRQGAAILAMLEAQQEILRLMREKQISDDVVGSAMSRYQQKWAVVNGGAE